MPADNGIYIYVLYAYLFIFELFAYTYVYYYISTGDICVEAGALMLANDKI
jgi:hypothetical protein